MKIKDKDFDIKTKFKAKRQDCIKILFSQIKKNFFKKNCEIFLQKTSLTFSLYSSRSKIIRQKKNLLMNFCHLKFF